MFLINTLKQFKKPFQKCEGFYIKGISSSFNSAISKPLK